MSWEAVTALALMGTSLILLSCIFLVSSLIDKASRLNFDLAQLIKRSK